MKEELKRIRKALKKENGLRFAYIYGSLGRGERDFSDIDIAVFSDKYLNSPNYEIGLSKRLGRLVGKPVDIRIINSMPLLLKSRLLKEGKLIFSRNRKKLLNFETNLISEYLDFSYLMREFDKKRLGNYGLR